MTSPYRALCAELLVALKSWSPHGGGPLECWEDREEEAALIARTEALLTQPEPEPVVLTRPDCFDFAMDFLGGKEEAEVRNYIERLESTARAALAHRAVPTNDELLQLAREWNSGHESIDFDCIADYAREVLARCGRSTFHSTDA